MGKFVTFPDRGDYETFDRPKYLRFDEGVPTIVRILDKQAHHVRKHWLNRHRSSVLCLGETCPICLNNAKIRAENPKNFRSVRGYIPIQNRYVVNVLDRTPVVIDPETGDEYYAKQGNFPQVSTDGSRSLVGIEPVNSDTIKVFERGRALFEQLLALHQETGEFDEEENLVSGGITSFDIKLVTMGEGRDKVISPIALTANSDDIAPILEEKELVPHILSTLGLLFTPEELEQVAYGGTSISDVFAERRANQESEVNQELLGDAQGKVADLFSEGDEELVEY
jgi:hypothetical protein